MVTKEIVSAAADALVRVAESEAFVAKLDNGEVKSKLFDFNREKAINIIGLFCVGQVCGIVCIQEFED